MATGSAISVILTPAMLMLSLAIADLRVAVASLFAGTLIALYPLCCAKTDAVKEPLLRALLTYQLMGTFLIGASITALGPAKQEAAVLLLFSTIFRLTLSFSTRSFFSTVFLIGPLSRLLFYLSNAVYSIFVVTRVVPHMTSPGVSLYIALPHALALVYLLARTLLSKNKLERFVHLTHASLCLPLVSLLFDSMSVTFAFCSIAAVLALFLLQVGAQPLDLQTRVFFGAQSFTTIESFLLRTSQLSHRIAGPVVVEWILVRAVSAGSVVIRLLTRLLSYTSLQRHFATGLFITALLLAYILRL